MMVRFIVQISRSTVTKINAWIDTITAANSRTVISTKMIHYYQTEMETIDYQPKKHAA